MVWYVIYIYIYIYIYILLAVALLLLILFPVYIKEDGVSATTGTATASTTSLTIASGKNTASVAITPTNAGGAFATSSSANKAEFNVSTNNYTGYTLAITASDDTGNLVNTTTSDTIASITANLTESSFNTSANNNKWGFKPSRYVSNNAVITNTGDGSVYLPSPTTTGTVLDHTTTPNTTANNYTIALGIRADHNTYAGTYTKTFTLVATANPSTYTINYSKNTTDTVSNLPTTSTTGSTSSTSITLPNTVPTRAHYSFLGWCNTTPTTNNGIDSCSGTVYNPNGAATNLTYGIDQTTANTTTLYAMWGLEKFTINLTISGGANGIVIDGMSYSGSSVSLAYGTHTISGSYNSGYEFSSWATSGNISVASTSSASTTLTVSGAGTLTLTGKQSCVTINGYLQDFTGTANYCSTTGTLTDSRDGTSYTVGKLADGKWWLLDNLALDLTNSTVKANLSATNTNASNTTLNYLKNGGGTTSDQYATAGVANWTSSYSYSAPLIATSGSGDNGSWTKDALQSYGSGSGKIGVYYNYCAASAGSYCYGNGTSYGSPSGNATEDICPAGWRMPTGGSSGEYQSLYTAYSSNVTNFKNALRTPLSGYFSYGSAYIQGSYGFFWSSTYVNSSGMYSLDVYSSNVNPQSRYDRYYGFSVRCVLQASDISQVSTMQDFAINDTAAIKNSMTEGQQYTLTDSRDSKSYTVAKIGSNVWMTKNLDLAGGTTLTAADSNVSAGCNLGGTNNCTLPASSADFDSSYTAVYNSGSTTCASGSPCYSYYSYAAATAGTDPSSGEATSDICPKGWRLPTQAEYNTLTNTYTTGATLTASPWHGVYAGCYYIDSILDAGGSEGYYWSSTANSTSSAYSLWFYSSNAYATFDDLKSFGYSVRCVAK